MKEFRKKQKRLYAWLKSIVIIGAVFLFVYIGVQPIVAEYNQTLAVVLGYLCDGLVIAILVLVFVYYTKYGKTDSFLTSIENEISDAGYYVTSRTEGDSESYLNVIYDDLSNSSYLLNKNAEISDFMFAFRGIKKKSLFYAVDVNDLDKNDILAYLDCVINDITYNNLKRKGSVVLCFVTNKADDSAIALSKMITPLGKKEQIKIALSIVELDSRKVYFLGNDQTKCQQMIANYVMNCDTPIKEAYIGKDKLNFQYELEERMKSFNLKDFRAGKFYAR